MLSLDLIVTASRRLPEGQLPMHKPPDPRRRPHRPGLPDPSGRLVPSRVFTSPLSRIRSGQGRLRWGQSDARREDAAGRRHKNERATQGREQKVGRVRVPSRQSTPEEAMRRLRSHRESSEICLQR